MADFLSLISRSRLSIAGAVLMTTAVLADALVIGGGLLSSGSNPYIGIVAWIALPALGLAGLALIPLGLVLRARRSGVKGIAGLAGVMRVVSRRKLLRLVLGLSFLNLILFSSSGYQAIHYMESPRFCGTLCHDVMGPEFNVYRRSPHSEVACVDCHVGGGIGHALLAKLDGTRQMLAVLTGSYSRPIETPIHNLRPARETCGTCHHPESFHGNMMKVIKHYASDENNTRTVTVLNMRVGGGAGPNKLASGIHWHVDKGSALRYYTSDPDREKIHRVEHARPDGSLWVWTNRELPMPAVTDPEGYREMDCVDCHNRPTHIFLDPGKAMDEWMADGTLDDTVPWLRALGEEVIGATYETTEAALAAIAGLPDLYRSRHPQVWADYELEITASVPILQDIYRLFVYPEMNLRWNTYPSMLGHPTEHTAACFRCHNGLMVDADGIPITTECLDCHYVLAERELDPMILRMLEDR